MKNVILLASIVLGAQLSMAGSATAVIECKSDSGRTRVRIGDDDFTSSLAFASVTVDGQTLSFDTAENPSAIYAIYDFKNKVLTQTVVNEVTHRQIKLWAIPQTLKVKQGDGYTKGTFTGILEGADPRNENEFLRDIQVNCTIDYSI